MTKDNKLDFTKFDLESYVSQFAQLDGQKSRSGDAWYRCCFHKEKSASLHVTNKQVFHCHGCGKNGGILDFIKSASNVSTKQAIHILTELSGQESVALEIEHEKVQFIPPTNFEAIYEFNNGHVLKYRLGRNLKVPFLWANFEDGVWWKGRGNHEIGLYAPNGLTGTVILAEGEKDADVLCSLGFNGASSPNGTYKWKQEYTDQLKQADKVVIMNDNDNQGINGAMMCHKELLVNDILCRRITPLEIEVNDKDGYDIDDVVILLGQEETKNRLQALIDTDVRWDRFIYNDEQILEGLTNLSQSTEVVVEPEQEIVEVEVVEESGLGEEYDQLIQKAVQEILFSGALSVLTEAEISKTAKKLGIGVRPIKAAIMQLYDKEKPKQVSEPINSAIVTVKDLNREIDISGSGYYVGGTSRAIFSENGDEILGHFLSFVGIVLDAETEQDTNVKVALAYNTPQDLDTIRVMVVPKKTLSQTNDMVKFLSGYNINVTQVNGLGVVQYLQTLQDHFNENTVTMKSLSRFGWFDGYLMPFEQPQAGVIFDSSVAQPTANKLIETKGDRELSLALMQEVVQYSESGALVLGAAVGSLVMSYINDGGNQSFALNLWGGTSTGKSVMCQAVASAFGYPYKDGWWGDGNATMNKDMYHNALLGNLPNFIDDPARNRGYDSDQKRDYIYSVTSGQGRGRMQRSGETAQDVREWCNIMIMTNETPFVDDSIQDGGAKARCLEVFFEKPLDTSTVQRWIDIMGKNYGHFPSEIANGIRNKGYGQLHDELKQYVRYFNSHGIDGKRTLNASIVMLGLSVAKEVLGLNPIDPKDWFIKQIRGSGVLDDGARAYIKLMNRVQVSENVYRDIYDRDNMFVGAFGYSSSGEKVIYLPLKTMAKYGKEEGFDHAMLIKWGYDNGRMVDKRTDNGTPMGIEITNEESTLKVVQLYYEWSGSQVTNDIARPYYTQQEIIEVKEERMEDQFNG